MKEKGSEAVYLTLYKKLRDDIIGGVYRHGEKLPSKRSLAANIGVSVITVRHAYEILCDEGYTVSKERSGYFVSYTDDDAFSTHFLSDKSVTSTHKDENISFDEYSFPFSVIAKKSRYVLSEYGEQLLSRSAGKGCALFREALSRYLARSRNIHVDTEQIVIGSGAEYLYNLVLQLLGRDKIYATEDPSYEKIRQVYEAGGAVCERLSLGKGGILTKELKSTKASVLHVSPYRSFPSGVTATVSKRLEYLRWAEKDGRYLIEDDFESEFTVSTKIEDTVFSLDKGDHVIYLNTFSRTVSPALRVAYMVLPKKLVPLFDEKLGFYSCSVPVFEQYLLTELINGGDFERHINRVRRIKRKKAETSNER